MRIEGDVNRIAKVFGVDPALLQAVVNAEGNIVKAVQCSIRSVSTRAEALQVTARSAVHAMCDWIKTGGEERKESFVAFWANRWAPVGASNDPAGLNANWARNVDRLWVPAWAEDTV